ncbi:hypothetical protein F2P81_010860 [Scophthalmus maximus]|uniref:Uncharacterized protein n=1 Tax=Scophthalmus maximus TaxID=52904 RepID=A0A6A4SS10_SCOMX|nr:hypothetical protein F2P81_010860 [Scophthalmus maximus]
MQTSALARKNAPGPLFGDVSIGKDLGEISVTLFISHKRPLPPSDERTGNSRGTHEVLHHSLVFILQSQLTITHKSISSNKETSDFCRRQCSSVFNVTCLNCVGAFVIEHSVHASLSQSYDSTEQEQNSYARQGSVLRRGNAGDHRLSHAVC